VRRDALDGLLPDVRDDAWFFDTELLVLAQRRGLRIHEVPVDWVDDPDSRVDIVRTAIEDLKGVARLALTGPVARFMAVGVLSTLAYALLFLLLRGPLGADGANIAALAITGVGNTAANRRLTFGVRGRKDLVRQHAAGFIVFLLTVGLTTGALAVLHGLVAAPPRALELAVLVTASTVAYSRPTAAIVHSACGRRMLKEENPSARADRPMSHSESGGLSTVMKLPGSSAPKNQAFQLSLAARAAAA